MEADQKSSRFKFRPRERRMLFYLVIVVTFAAWKFIPRPWHATIREDYRHHFIESTATRTQIEEIAGVLEILYGAYSNRFGTLPEFRREHARAEAQALLGSCGVSAHQSQPRLGRGILSGALLSGVLFSARDKSQPLDGARIRPSTEQRGGAPQTRKVAGGRTGGFTSGRVGFRPTRCQLEISTSTRIPHGGSMNSPPAPIGRRTSATRV